MEANKFDFLDHQPIGITGLRALDQKIDRGDINPEFLGPLVNKIQAEVAKLTPAQRTDPEFQATVENIMRNTGTQLAQIGLKQDIQTAAANDDFFRQVA